MGTNAFMQLSRILALRERSAVPLSVKMTPDEYLAIGKQWGATLGEDECPFEDKSSDWGWYGERRVALDYSMQREATMSARQMALGGLACALSRQAVGREPLGAIGAIPEAFLACYRVAKLTRTSIRALGERQVDGR
jgi:hypothetical protein